MATSLERKGELPSSALQFFFMQTVITNRDTRRHQNMTSLLTPLPPKINAVKDKRVPLTKVGSPIETSASLSEALPLFSLITLKRRNTVFLTVIGEEAYEELNLVFSLPHREKTLDEVKVLSKNDYSPSISIIAEKFRFSRRVQIEHESVEEIVTEINNLA